MAIQPIVLQSRLIRDTLGALPNASGNNSYTNPDPVTQDPAVKNMKMDEDGNAILDEDGNEIWDGTYTIPTYKRVQIDIPDDYDWSQYGKSGEALRFFSKVRTGEIQYDPSKDQITAEDIAGMGGEPGDPNLGSEAEQIREELIAVATMAAGGVGANVGRSIAANYETNLSNNSILPSTDNISGGFSDYVEDFKPLDLIKSPTLGSDGEISSSAKIERSPVAAGVDAPTSFVSGFQDRTDTGLIDGTGSVAGRSNLYGAAGAGAFTLAANLIAGKSLKESVQSGAKVSFGTFLGTAIGGPVGGFIGGMLGGRLICNELMRQGMMTRKQLILDYKFTKDYLTPQHVLGYHVWAIWMVRQMRKGRFVNFWTHVARHRANEIAYIYGEREKPDYLGKVYRKIGEPICWSIGFFCKKTDWTILYKEKEI